LKSSEWKYIVTQTEKPKMEISKEVSYMTRAKKRSLITATFFAVSRAIPLARAADHPADLCSLLSAAQVSKALGQTFNSPAKHVAPRPYPNTAEGTDGTYSTTRGDQVLFRAYVDPSPPDATSTSKSCLPIRAENDRGVSGRKKEQLQKDRAFEQKDNKCTQTAVAADGNKIDPRFVCEMDDVKASGLARVEAINPESVKGSGEITATSGDHTIKRNNRLHRQVDGWKREIDK
jgi:hypothetical protein